MAPMYGIGNCLAESAMRGSLVERMLQNAGLQSSSKYSFLGISKVDVLEEYEQHPRFRVQEYRTNTVYTEQSYPFSTSTSPTSRTRQSSCFRHRQNR